MGRLTPIQMAAIQREIRNHQRAVWGGEQERPVSADDTEALIEQAKRRTGKATVSLEDLIRIQVGE